MKNRMTNNVDPDETAHDEPSHQDLHCLQKCLSWSTGLKGLNLVLWYPTLSPSVLFIFLWVSFGWSALICVICVCKLLSFYSFSNKRTHVCRSPCRNNPLDIYICQDEYTALRFDMALNIQLKWNEVCFQLKCVRNALVAYVYTEGQDQPVYPCTFW